MVTNSFSYVIIIAYENNQIINEEEKMKKLLVKTLSAVLSVLMLFLFATTILAQFPKDEICDIMVYADEEYFPRLDDAEAALVAISENNITICDRFSKALFGFYAQVPGKYVDVIDKSEYFDASICGSFEPLSTGYSTQMMYAQDMINTGKSHNTDYTGRGTVVAVIDNGFDINHEVFAYSPENPSVSKEYVDSLADEDALFGAFRLKEGESFYISEKIPFAFNYTNGTTDVSTLETHGTHVAAIIGGKSDTVTGVAPDCQLLLMKVFDSKNANAREQFVAAALEDAVALGADVINLSIGTYSGSENSTAHSIINRMAKNLEKAGITVVCAAGNDASSGSNSTFSAEYGIPYPLASMTDFGTINHPAVIESFIAVGSCANTHISYNTLVHKDIAGNIKRIEYTDTNATLNIIKGNFTRHFGKSEIGYCVIDGVGADSDYTGENADITGKIALVERGVITFSEKVNNAAKHGALAVIVYGNDDEKDVLMDLTGCSIPAVFISKDDGRYLKNAPNKKLIFDGSLSEFTENENAYSMSSFSSWGMTPDMKLKPDVTAVGESIYSAVPGNTYTSLSGTSMATPFVSGVAALLNEKLDLEESKYILSKRPLYIKQALMTSATPLIDKNTSAEYSPRVQGAGLINVSNALNASFIITGLDSSPYLTLKKEDDHYFLELLIKNLTSEKISIALDTSILTDSCAGAKLEYNNKKNDYVFNLLESVKTDNYSLGFAENESIYTNSNGKLKLDLAGSAECYVRLNLSFDVSEKTKYFDNGYFIDGYLYASSENFNGSVPFVGFEGEFDASDIFDATIYSGEMPFFKGNLIKSNTPSQKSITLGEENGGIVAFSPNNDGYFDLIYLVPSLLKNINGYTVEILDEYSNTIYSSVENNPLTKGSHNSAEPILVWDGKDGMNPDYIFPDGNYTLKVSACAEGSDNTQSMTIPFIVDTTAPTIKSIATTSLDGKTTLEIEAVDESRVKSITLYNSASLDKKSQSGFSQTKPYDKDDIFAFDITSVEGSVLWADVSDFAMNTKTFKIDIKEIMQ